MNSIISSPPIPPPAPLHLQIFSPLPPISAFTFDDDGLVPRTEEGERERERSSRATYYVPTRHEFSQIIVNKNTIELQLDDVTTSSGWIPCQVRLKPRERGHVPLQCKAGAGVKGTVALRCELERGEEERGGLAMKGKECSVVHLCIVVVVKREERKCVCVCVCT